MKTCDECGELAATSEPIKDGRSSHYLCGDCLWTLAEEIAEGFWGLIHFSGPPEAPATEDDQWRMMCAAFISLNQRIAADAIAERLGILIAWREDA